MKAYQGDVTELHSQLVTAAGYQDVWVVGGGDAAAQFAGAGLIDEMIVSYAPCTLGTGGRLLPLHTEWTLIESGRQRRLHLRALAKGLTVACRETVAANEFP